SSGRGSSASPAPATPPSPTSASVRSPSSTNEVSADMTYRLRNIVVAVGLALVALLLTTFYVSNYKRHVRQSESTVKVYAAKRDVPQGTSGAEMIKRHLMVTSDVTERTVVPGYVS